MNLVTKTFLMVYRLTMMYLNAYHFFFVIYTIRYFFLYNCKKREEILESRKRRTKQLEIILEESKARLNDHNTKRKILNDNDKEIEI